MNDFQIFILIAAPLLCAVAVTCHALYARWKDGRPMKTLLEGDTSDELEEQS